MTANTTLPTSDLGGDTIRTIDRTTFKVPVSVIDVGGSAGEALIGDGSNTMPVSGTVTANLSATDNAVLDAIAASVAGTLTVGSHAVTNAGVFAVQVTSAPTTAVTGPLTDAQLRATPVPVSGTVTATVGTVTAVTTVGTITNVVHIDDNAGSITIDNAALSVTGGGVEAAALRVTLANDSTGVLSIDDNGGSITVDGTFWQATQPVSIAAAVAVTDNSGSLTVDNSGTFVVQVNGDALTSLQLLDDVVSITHDPAGTKGLLIGAKYDNVVLPLDDGDFGFLLLDSGRRLCVDDGDTQTLLTAMSAKLPSSLGIKTAANSLSVAPASDAVFAASQNGTWTVTATISAGAATIAKAEDAAHSTGDTGVFALTVRSDTAASTAGTDGDYAAFTTDSTGRLHVNVGNTVTVASHAVTNAGTFAVQSTLQAGTAYVGKVRLTDGTTDADVRDLANSNAINVAIVDSSGDQIASFGGGTQYTEGDTDATIVGTVMMMEVAANTLQPVQGTVADGLLVNLGSNNDVTVTGTVTANIGTVGTLATAANQTTIIGHVDGIEGLLTTIDTDTGNIATSVATIAGAVSGTEMQVDVLTMPTVTVTGTVTATVSAGATTIAKAEDSAHAGGDTGVYILAVRSDTAASTATTDGDYTSLITDSTGKLHVNVGNTVTVASHAVTNAGTFAVQSTLQAGTAYAGKVRLTDGTTDVDIRDLTNSNAINVSIVDGSGDQITSFGGGTQYTEGATDASITGTAMLMEVAADTLQPVQGTVADGLLVNLGSNNDVTVTGTVTANIGTVGTLATAANQTTIIGHVDGIEGLLTTIDTDTGNIATSVATIAGAVSGTEVQVDVLTMPTVTVTGTVSATISASATTIAKEEDAASANGDVGVSIMAVRKATPANTSGTDGDYEMLQMSAGRLWTSTVIDTALPAGTNAIGKLASNTGVTIGAVEIASAQTIAAVTTLGTITNVVNVADNSGSLTVDAPVNVPVFVRLSDGASAITTLPVSGTVTATIAAGASTIAKAEDDAHVTADVGVFVLSVRKDTAATTAGTDGDYAAMTTDSAGRLHCNVSNNVSIIGSVAHDAADANPPVKIGAKASTTIVGNALVSDADRTDLKAGADGILITRPHTVLEDIVQERATNTDGASTAFSSGLGAPGAGIRLWITGVCIANSSATDITVDLRDGSGGSVLWTLSAPGGGGCNWQFNPPLRLTANTALAFDGSAAATTLTVSANGFKSKI